MANDTIWNYVGNKQMLKMKKASETEKGGIDMRCAIDEIYEDGLAEGEKRGIAGMLDLLKELGCSTPFKKQASSVRRYRK